MLSKYVENQFELCENSSAYLSYGDLQKARLQMQKTFISYVSVEKVQGHISFC